MADVCFDLPLIKIERARKLRGEVAAEIDAFHSRTPYEIHGEIDALTGKRTCRLRIKEQVPKELSATVADAVHNLRAALDQIVWQLVIANGETPSKRTCFPIANNRAQFLDYMNPRQNKVAGISSRSRRLIRRLRPYGGGIETFWQIHQLDIIDKHQTILTTGAANTHMQLQHSMSVPWEKEPMKGPDLIFNMVPKFPLVDGMVLTSFTPIGSAGGGSMDFDPKFYFQVAFGQQGVVDGEPVIPALDRFITFTERTIVLLTRYR